MNRRLIEQGYEMILQGLGDDLAARHPDLERTPHRAAKFLAECLASEGVTNADLAKRFGKSFPAPASGGAVVVRDIPIFSFCEHHIALMYDMAVDVAYVPTDRVIGLSKIARIADAVGRRLQIQERLTSDIVEVLSMAVSPAAVVVHVRGKHSCVTARGARKDALTTTEASCGDPAGVAYLREILHG